eukprot:scaffold42907_cov16-Tisochrysis_lutea.AAC.1
MGVELSLKFVSLVTTKPKQTALPQTGSSVKCDLSPFILTARSRCEVLDVSWKEPISFKRTEHLAFEHQIKCKMGNP